MIWIEDVKDIADATPEECAKLGIPYQPNKTTHSRISGEFQESRNHKKKNMVRTTPYERTRAAVYATGNKWAIENFEATHN